MKLYLAVNVDTCFMASMKMQLICCSKYTLYRALYNRVSEVASILLYFTVIGPENSLYPLNQSDVENGS